MVLFGRPLLLPRIGETNTGAYRLIYDTNTQPGSGAPKQKRGIVQSLGAALGSMTHRYHTVWPQRPL